VNSPDLSSDDVSCRFIFRDELSFSSRKPVCFINANNSDAELDGRCSYGSYPEPDESSACSDILFLEDQFRPIHA
jgi:hypothetical protein